MNDSIATGQSLTFSRLLQIDARAQNTEDLLSLAQARAVDPDIFTEFPPYFFNAQISSSRWDAYDTRMLPSTLRNFADDAAAGVAFLRNHNTREDPIGHSLTGTFTGAQGNGIALTRAAFYLLTDPATAPYINKIRSGVVRDVSVGFYGGQWLCTICGRDMMDWFSRDGCPHMLGMTYTPKDEAGKQQGDPVMARAEIDGAHLAETSGVYDGATPGAMIDKARALALDGQFDDTMRGLLQVRYHTHLPERLRSFTGTTIATNTTNVEEGPTMPPEATPVAAPAADPTLIQVRSVLATGTYPAEIGAEPEAQVRWLLAEQARLAPLADDGRAYRADLVEQAITEGVRANGPDFAVETYTAMLASAPIAVIKRMRDDWQAIGNKQFPGGRATQEQAPAAETPATEHTFVPDAAFVA